jgi:FecR protein
MSNTSHLPSSLLLLALAAAYPAHAFANAATAQFSIGEVSVQRSAASTPLASGGRVDSGDLITTGNTGRTQLRFTDGGMVSLQPNSQFKISKYADAGDGKQDSFLVDLARGGMRALTGLIGKRNRDNYKVTTTTATIGIRGSGFSMAYNADGTLGVTTEQDAIDVCTQAGCVGLNLGESALVTSATALPTRARERAHWNPPQPRRLITARNDDVNENGAALNITRLVPGLAFSGAGLDAQGGLDVRLYGNGTAALSGTELAGYQSQNGNRISGGSATVLSLTGSYAGGDLMVLGTWQNSAWTGGAVQTNLSTSAFVMGQATPAAGFAGLFPTTAIYTMQSATPVFSSTGPAGVLDSASISVDFANPTAPIGINMFVSFGTPNVTSPLSVAQPPQAAQVSVPFTSYGLSGTGNLINGTAGFNIPLVVTPQGATACATAPCTGNARGFFVGPTAQGAGLSFTANTGAGNGNIGGAATFTRGGVTNNVTN